MSLLSTLSIARSALAAHSLRTQVAAHNIANANTDGYSAQRPELTPGPSYATADGIFGTGVQVTDIGRLRDAFMDATFREESSDSSASTTRRDMLQRVESVLGEPSDTGLANSLDAFWSSWSDLANNPMDGSAHSVLAERGAQLAAEFNRRADGLAQVKSDSLTRLSAAVDRLNTLSSQVADLNHRIVALESGGHTAGDLRDQRDLALDEIATLVPLQVVEHTDGSVAANVDGNLVVDGAVAMKFNIVPPNNGAGYQLQTERGTTVYQLAGSIGGMLDVLNTKIPDTASRLDSLAAGIVSAVNAWHATGTDAAGATGQNFFDPAGTRAGTMAVDARIKADPSLIAAGTATNGAYAAGKNDVASGIAALREATTHLPDPTDPSDPFPGKTFGDVYSGIVTDVGTDVAAAKDSATVHASLAEQANNRRESVSGVSTDEELTHLIEAQSAFSAAAKIVTTVDDMMQTLLDIKR